MLKKILYNILSIFIIILLFEVISLSILSYQYRHWLYNFLTPGDFVSRCFKIRMFSPENYDDGYRAPLFGTKDKNILIFGCSFGFGVDLDDYHNFSGYLNKLTNFNVFNRSEAGIGPQIMLYQFETKKVLDITKNCDYVIYVYIPDHLRRHMMFRCFPFLEKVTVRYMLNKDDELKLQMIPSYLAYSNIYKLYESKALEMYGEDYSKKLLYKIIEQSNKLSKEFYPNSKFIVFNYSQEKFPIEKELQNLGIQVVSIIDLTDVNLSTVEYQLSEYDDHPNAKAWEFITPLFIKRAKIN